MDAIKCKYFNENMGKRNGKACMLDPQTPHRCWTFFYENKECEHYKEKKEARR